MIPFYQPRPPIETIGFYDAAGRRAEIKPPEPGADSPRMLVVRQDVLENLLEEQLAKRKVRVKWSHALSKLQERGSGGVLTTVDQWGKESVGYAVATTRWVLEKTVETEAAFVIGADGHRSAVRRLLGIPYESMAAPDFFAVFEFRCGKDLGGEVRIVLDEKTTNVLWPLPDGNCRWSFQLPGAEIPEESRLKSRLAVQIDRQAFPFLTKETLEKMIAERAPWFDAPIEEIVWSLAVRFERRLAREFGRGRCRLAGDAAHLAAPVSVRSMNVGLSEAHDLTSRLAKILRDGAPLALLDEYNQARQEEWRWLFGLEGGAVAGEKADPWVRENGGRVLSCIPASGEDLVGLARQAGLEVARPARQDPATSRPPA